MKKYGPFKIQKDSAGRRRVTKNGARSSFAELEQYQRAKVAAGRKAYREAWKYPEPGDKKPSRVMSNQDKRLIVNYLRKNQPQLANSNYKKVTEELEPDQFKKAIDFSKGEPRKTIVVEVAQTDGNQRYDISAHIKDTKNVKGKYFIDGEEVTATQYRQKLKEIGQEYENKAEEAGNVDFYSAYIELEVDEAGNTFLNSDAKVTSVLEENGE